MKYLLWSVLSAGAMLCNAVAQYAPSIVSISQSRSVPQGQTLTLSVSANGTLPFTFEWTKDGEVVAATGNTYTIPSVAVADTGSYAVTVANASGSVTSGAILIEVTPAIPPSFYYQPGALTYTVGNTMSLSVSVAGTSPLTFVWKKGTTTLATSQSSTYRKEIVEPSDGGKYSVTVSNVAGSVTSNPFTVTIEPVIAPVFTSNPSNVTVNPGDYFSLYAWVSNSAGVTFQWYKDEVAIAGATSSSYGKTAFAGDAGKYVVVATNSAGSTSSSAATVTMRPPTGPTNLSITQGPLSVRLGQSFNLYISVSGTSPMTFQWQKDGVIIPQATSSSYYSAAATADDAGVYSVVASNVVGSATSNETLLSVIAEPTLTITREPASRIVYPGEYASFSVQATGEGALAYQWYKDGVPVSGANGNSYTTTPASAADGGIVTVIVSDARSAITSQPAELIVESAVAPTILTHPASVALEPGRSLSLSVTANGRPTPRFQWKKDGVAIIGATNSSYSNYSVASTDSGDYTVEVVNDAGSVLSEAATVVVSPPRAPVIRTHPASSSVLAGESFQLWASVAPSPGTTLQWYRDGLPVTGATDQSYWVSNAQPSHAGTYHLVATGSTGSATSYDAVLSVDLSSARPVITYTSGSMALQEASYASINISIAPGVPNPMIVWKKDGVTVPNANAATLSFGSFKREAVGIYTAEVTSSGITYTSRPIVISVLNDGVAPAILRQPSSVLVNSGQWASFQVQADGEAPLSYQWKKDGTNIPGATSTGYSLSDVVVAYAGDYSVVVSNRVGSVTSEVATLTVSAGGAVPLIGRHPTSQRLTLDVDSLSLSVEMLNSGSSWTYQWYKDGTAINGATSSSYYRSTITAAHAGRYKLVITSGTTTTTSQEAVISVVERSTAPVFTTQPAAAVGVKGGSVTLTALATGGTPTYQWRRNGSPIVGATDATLTLTNLQGAQGGSYTVIAANAGGWTTSAIATLSIAPSFTTHPVSQNAVYGGSVTFAATADGAPAPTYQWTHNATPIAGATQATLTLENLQAADAGTYSVVATNSAGSATSRAATLTLFAVMPSAPEFTTHPQSQAHLLGRTASFTVNVTGTAPLIVQWIKDGAVITGATGTTLTLADVTESDAGTYQAVASNPYGYVESAEARLTIGSKPVAQVYMGTFSTGENWALQVSEDGTATFLGMLSGTHQMIYARDFTIDANGEFAFGETSPASHRNPRLLAISTPARATGLLGLSYDGRISGQISGGNVTGQIAGLSITFSGTQAELGTTAAYAGSFDAVPLGSGPGEIHAMAAPDGRLLLVEATPAGVRGGLGTVTASGAFSITQPEYSYAGTLSTTTASLSGTYQPAGQAPITLAPPPSVGNGRERLVNVSTRGVAGVDSKTLIAGFVVTGDSPKDVLVRAIGPALGPLGVSGFLPNPRLSVYRGSSMILENDDWSADSKGLDVEAVAARVGASPCPRGSRDSAVVARLEPGVYTAHLTSADNGAGVALIEVYDASPATAGVPKIVNLSARCEVGRGENVLVVGFVVTGAVPKQILVRGVGPALAAQGVTGALGDPTLRLYKGSAALGGNDNWSSGEDAAEIAAAAATVGAFALPVGGNDAAFLVYLAPGVYTAHVSGVNDTTGVALVEVYEVP